MAGRKKNLTLEEELAKITEQIDIMESALQKLKIHKAELEEKLKQAQLAELYEMIMQSGKSFEEVRKLLSEDMK